MEKMNMDIEKLDIDSIFTKYTINEIRDIEEKMKIDMEKKKEELRSMVGERYRDLIEAADAIFEMKNCAKGIEQAVQLLNSKCSKIDQTLTSATSSLSSSTGKSDTHSMKMALAVSVKILTDTRRLCWMYLQDHDYIKAARQYLLAQHMAASFLSNTSDHPLDADSQKAIAATTRLWHQTRHMKNTILDHCRLYLKTTNGNVQILANALATLIAFGGRSIEQALNEFLAAKLEIIKESYTNVDLSSYSTEQSSKDTVRQLLLVFIDTIFELDMIFSGNYQTTDQYDQLRKYLSTFFQPGKNTDNMSNIALLSTAEKQMILAEETFFKNCDPVDLSNYESEQQLMHKTIDRWLQHAFHTVKTGLNELLNHVTSLKSLLHLKASLVSLLTEERMQQWPSVCHRLFNNSTKEIHLWNDLIKTELRTRAKHVLHVRFEQFNQSITEKIERCLQKYQTAEKNHDRSASFEFDVLSYIWSNVDNHIPSDYVWTPSSSRLPVGDAKFSLKAVGVSMNLQNLCRELDNELRQILDDVQEFSMADGSSSTTDSLLSFSNSNPNSMYSDSGFVEEHLEGCVMQFCTTLIAHLRHIANENEKIGDEERTLTSLIWLGSCARAIPIVCKNLKNALEFVTTSNETITSPVLDRKLRGISQPKRTLDKSEKTSWSKTRDLFMGAHVDLFKQWITHLCAHIDMQLRNQLSTFLDDIPTVIWDEIEIEESLDTDKTYKSVIRVPMYCTPFIEELLFYSCQQINHALAHGLDKDLSSEMAHRLLQTFFNVYDSWWIVQSEKRTSKKRSQTRLIQLVYDLRFVHMLLERKDSSAITKDINERFFKLIETIEAEIDPFDLNVLSPYMQSHLQKMVPRSSLLFGHLITNDRLIPSKPLPMTTQDTNNILSLSSCSQRFSLLPVATNASNTSANAPLASKGKNLKSSINNQSGPTNDSAGDVNAAPMRPLASNVAEVATYYSKWFQNIVK